MKREIYSKRSLLYIFLFVKLAVSKTENTTQRLSGMASDVYIHPKYTFLGQNRRYSDMPDNRTRQKRSNSAKIRPFSPFSLLLTYKVSSEGKIIDCGALFYVTMPKSYRNQPKSRHIQAHPGPKSCLLRAYIHVRTRKSLQRDVSHDITTPSIETIQSSQTPSEHILNLFFHKNKNPEQKIFEKNYFLGL